MFVFRRDSDKSHNDSSHEKDDFYPFPPINIFSIIITLQIVFCVVFLF